MILRQNYTCTYISQVCWDQPFLDFLVGWVGWGSSCSIGGNHFGLTWSINFFNPAASNQFETAEKAFALLRRQILANVRAIPRTRAVASQPKTVEKAFY